jgi:hypothetical protein
MKFKKESKCSEDQKDEDYQKTLKDILLNNSSNDVKLNPSLILEEIKINKENQDNGLNANKFEVSMCNIDHEYACLPCIPVIHQKFGFAVHYHPTIYMEILTILAFHIRLYLD